MAAIKNMMVTVLLISFHFIGCNNSTPPGRASNNQAKRGELRIMFYNTENFFDIYNDSLTRDDEFLPEGSRHWNNKRFTDKLNKLCKVIIAVGGWEPPEIIGLCEVENTSVLYKLIYETPLSKYDYGIVHRDSPDSRGIDVALLYRKDKLVLLDKIFFNICFPGDSLKKTRDILYFKGKVFNKDTLHIFINHWPSRYGGQIETEPYRIYASRLLKNKVDSVFNINKRSKIIITGDFNDEPENKSLAEYLSAVNRTDLSSDTITDNKLYNLSYTLSGNAKLGSYKYRSEWDIFDQFIVSGTLLNSRNVSTSKDDIHIFDAPFLMKKDDRYSGYRPFRTYWGYKYEGGFSDHLPVYLDLH
jgi:predicted extracellular nuclease